MVWTAEQRDEYLRGIHARGEEGLIGAFGAARVAKLRETAAGRNVDIFTLLRETPLDKLEAAVQQGQTLNLRPQTPPQPARGATIAQQNPFAPRPAPQVGIEQRIGKYVIHAELGRGGMGRVLLAYDPELNRKCAIKETLTSNADDLLRFTQESQNMAKLKHPAIIDVYDRGMHDGKPFFAMEYVDGSRTLDRVLVDLARNPKRWDTTARIVKDIADGLEHAHAAGIIHRDLKPANILITPSLKPKIADFGLAKDLQKAGGLTIEGDILGTPVYMPPEQALGLLSEIGPHSDVYSLGLMLYQMITLSSPYAGRNHLEVFSSVCDMNVTPPAPHTLTPDVPQELENICLKATRKNKTERYESAEAFAEDLDNYLAGRPITAMPESVNKRMVRAVKRNATSILASALAASMVIGGIGYGVQNSRSQADKLHATEADARAANAIQERQSLEIKAAQAERESRSSARDVYVREMQKAETEERWNDALRFGEAALALTPNGGPRDEIVRHIRVISGEVPVQIRIPPGVRMTYQIDLVKEGSTEGVFPPHGSASESRSVPLVRGKTYMIGVGCEDGAQYSFCIRPQKPMEILLRNVPALPGFIFLPQEVQNIYVSRWPVAWDSYQQFLRANRIDPAIDNPLIPRDARGPFTTERIRLEQLSGSHPVTGISITQAERFLAYFQVGLNRSGKSGYTARLPTLKELEAAVVSGYTYPWGGTIRPEMMRSVPENVRSSSPMGSYLIPTSIHTGSSDRAPDPRCAVTLSRLHLSNISILVSDEGHFYSAMSDCTETDPRLHAVIESRAGGPRIPAREISRDASSTYTGFYIVVEPPK